MSRDGMLARSLAPPWKIAPRLLLTRFFPARALSLLVKGAWPKERKKAYIRCVQSKASVSRVFLSGWVSFEALISTFICDKHSLLLFYYHDNHGTSLQCSSSSANEANQVEEKSCALPASASLAPRVLPSSCKCCFVSWGHPFMTSGPRGVVEKQTK